MLLSETGRAKLHGLPTSVGTMPPSKSLHYAAYSTSIETTSHMHAAADKCCVNVSASVDNGGRNALHHLLDNCPSRSGYSFAKELMYGRDGDGNTPLAALRPNTAVLEALTLRRRHGSDRHQTALNGFITETILPFILNKTSWAYPCASNKIEDWKRN